MIGTACLGLRSLQPITAQDVVTALGGRGFLECYTIEPQQTGMETWTDVAKVTFAFVDDCRDAIKASLTFYLIHFGPLPSRPLLYCLLLCPFQLSSLTPWFSFSFFLFPYPYLSISLLFLRLFSLYLSFFILTLFLPSFSPITSPLLSKILTHN